MNLHSQFKTYLYLGNTMFCLQSVSKTTAKLNEARPGFQKSFKRTLQDRAAEKGDRMATVTEIIEIQTEEAQKASGIGKQAGDVQYWNSKARTNSLSE